MVTVCFMCAANWITKDDFGIAWSKRRKPSLPGNNICQDPTENFFGCQRQWGGRHWEWLIHFAKLKETAVALHLLHLTNIPMDPSQKEHLHYYCLFFSALLISEYISCSFVDIVLWIHHHYENPCKFWLPVCWHHWPIEENIFILLHGLHNLILHSLHFTCIVILDVGPNIS